MTTEAKRVLARGVEVRLSDGEPRRLRFDLDALEHLEAAFGSLAAFSVSLRESLGGFSGPRIKVVRESLRAGLSREEYPVEREAELVTIAEIRGAEVISAIAEAWLEAVPSGGQGSGKASAEESESIGPGSTTSARSDTVAPIASGAV